MARELAPDAMAKIGQLIKSDLPNIALAAAQHVLDRAIGRPINMSADVTDRLDEFTDEQLDAAIADLSHRLALAQDAAGEKGTETVTH